MLVKEIAYYIKKLQKSLAQLQVYYHYTIFEIFKVFYNLHNGHAFYNEGDRGPGVNENRMGWEYEERQRLNHLYKQYTLPHNIDTVHIIANKCSTMTTNMLWNKEQVHWF